jgi:hypothetical protein
MTHLTRMVLVLTVALEWQLSAHLAGQRRPNGPAASTLPRAPDGRPDLQGNWNISTLTPLERSAELGDRQTLTAAEAAALEQRTADRTAQQNAPAPPKSAAPPVGGNVGGYNNFWLDGGTTVATLNGRKLASLIVEPADGRIPFRPEALKAQIRARGRYGKGPYETYTDLDTGERCLTDGIPWTPFAYNNNFQIVQTAGHVVILREQFAELRIIPIGVSRHPGPAVGQWAGASHGNWAGDTLVVETTNFADKTRYEWADTWRAARPALHIVERFTLVDRDTLHYEFTVDDQTTFTTRWTAIVPMMRTDDRLYEYACHEGNVAIGNILRGARAAEAEEAAKQLRR